MPRVKLSEYKAKQLLLEKLNSTYHGLSVKDPPNINIQSLREDINYVVKVDQGIKGRMKKGLVALKVKKREIKEKIRELGKRGYDNFIVEPYLKHEPNSERFLSLERVREGIAVYYSKEGGIDIEERHAELKYAVVPYNKSKSSILRKVANHLGVEITFIQNLLQSFEEYYISFLEINPLVVEDGKVNILDLAVEVDSAGEYFVGKLGEGKIWFQLKDS